MVVAIIMLLAAMLLPALRNAKERGRSTVCLGNLRQLGMSSLLYAQDYADWLPANGDAVPWSGDVNMTAERWSTERRLENYGIKWESKAKLCPSNQDPWQVNAVKTGYYLAGPVSAGTRYCGPGQASGPWPRVGDLSNPTRVITFFEVFSEHYNYPEGTQYAGLINGRVNVVYLDGHAGSQVSPQMQACGGLFMALESLWYNYRLSFTGCSSTLEQRVNTAE